MASKKIDRKVRGEENRDKESASDTKGNPSEQVTGVADANQSAEAGRQQSDPGDDAAKEQVETKGAWRAIAYYAWVQADVSNRQWGAMEAQNEILQEQIRQTDETISQMRLDQRAWVTIAVIDIPTVVDGRLKPAFCFHNFGKSPATVTMYNISSYTENEPFDDALAAEMHARSVPDCNCKWIVAPNAAIPIGEKEELDIQITDDVASGRSTCLIFATVKYVDAMNIPRETQSCWVYSPTAKNGLVLYGKQNYIK